jgi:hypothetical protein
MYYGYEMDETHLYVSNEPWPRKNGDYTVAPGQYPYHDDDATLVTDTIVRYVITTGGGDIYIIAHAVVCGNGGYGGYGDGGYGGYGGYNNCR